MVSLSICYDFLRNNTVRLSLRYKEIIIGFNNDNLYELKGEEGVDLFVINIFL